MLIDDRKQLDRIMAAIADALDIPDHVYEDATIKYEDVGDHLGADDSPLNAYSPEIYVQGSFRLGTIVRPLDQDGEYDIDQVCRLTIEKPNITQSELKEKIGDRLSEREDFRLILEESRRCWTLKYPQERAMPAFHLDILPSIPNEERPPSGILLSDKELRLWQKSNPVAYAEWFKERMAVVFEKKAAVLAESMSANIEDVPEWRVKTPLQRSIQILKRHRDNYFSSDSDDRPVSIIITTLAGHAYKSEENVFDALHSIVKRMPNFIENRDGIWWVENPVDEDENFVDKWNEYPERREAFLRWLKRVEEDFTHVSKAESLQEGVELLVGSIGERTMSKVSIDLGVQRSSMLPSEIRAAPVIPPLGSEAHALHVESKYQVSEEPAYSARVFGDVHFKKGPKKGRRLWAITDSVPKRVWLKFRVKTNVPEPYAVEWQITNTGEEAEDAGQPRGDFYPSDDPQKHIRWEETAFRGTHWVRALILNGDGVCVAKSDKFLVKVR